MYEIRVQSDFSSAHSLRGYRGKCEGLHGHNWKVIARLGSEELDHLGMVVDFKILKEELQKVLEGLDHKYLNDIPPFDTINPSSENLARHIFVELKRAMDARGLKVIKVTVWESDNSAGSYWE
jgi:6-pyruvoyltetrahydropterin/6-carboxytetrahydropterin synthase